MSDIRYKRVLLKLSGEALMGDGQYGIDPKVTDHLAKQVKELLAVGHEVGVVVGGAFTAIVTALVDDVINPLIGLFFKADFSDVVIGLGGSSIKIGEFVNSIINFLIVAFVLFVVIKFVNSLHKKPEEPAAPEEPTTKVCPYCQSEISIKAVRCPHCTSKLEGFPEINN